MCALRGERVGLAVSESQGRTMRLFMGDPTLRCPPGLKQPKGQLYAQDHSTLSLVAWQHNGHCPVGLNKGTQTAIAGDKGRNIQRKPLEHGF